MPFSTFSFLNRKKKKDDKTNQARADLRNPAVYKTSQDYANLLIQGAGNPEPQQQPRQQVQRQQQPSQPQQPQPQQPQRPSPTQQYISRMGNNAQQRASQAEQRAQQQQELQKQLTQGRQNTLQKIGGIQDQAFDKYVNQVRGGVDIQRGTAKRQIGQTESNYYDQKRQNEQARRERMKGLEGTLASLGTLQSSAMGNIGAKINMGAERQDRQAQQQMSDRVADIQDQVRLAENQAEGLIQQEAANYQMQKAQLAQSMDENSIEFKQAVNALDDQADQRINKILDSFDEFSYNAQLQMLQSEANSGAEIPKIETDLRQELFNRAKEQGFTDVQNAYSRILSAPESTYGDLTRITSFMKILDPGSVVRESEFDTAAEAAGVLQNAYGFGLQLTGEGRLTPAARAKLEAAADEAYQSNAREMQDLVNYYTNIAEQRGADPRYVVGEYGFYEPNTYQSDNSPSYNQSSQGSSLYDAIEY